MRRTLGWMAVLVVCTLGFARAAGAGGESTDDTALFDARVTDTKGITTDLRDFGYATGVNVLMAYRGDADIEIPYRLIRRLDISDFVPQNRRAPATVTLRSGKAIAVELDAIEEGRLMQGNAEFGEYRIRMGKIRRLELFGNSTSAP